MNARPLGIFKHPASNYGQGYVAVLSQARDKNVFIKGARKLSEEQKTKMKWKYLETILTDESMKPTGDGKSSLAVNLTNRCLQIGSWASFIQDTKKFPAENGKDDKDAPIIVVCGQHRLWTLLILDALDLLIPAWKLELRNFRPLIYEAKALPYLDALDQLTRNLNVYEVKKTARDEIKIAMAALVTNQGFKKPVQIHVLFNSQSIETSCVSVNTFRGLSCIAQFMYHWGLGTAGAYKATDVLLDAFISHPLAAEFGIEAPANDSRLSFFLNALAYLYNEKRVKLWKFVKFLDQKDNLEKDAPSLAGLVWLGSTAANKSTKPLQVLEHTFRVMFGRHIAERIPVGQEQDSAVAHIDYHVRACLDFLNTGFCSLPNESTLSMMETFKESVPKKIGGKTLNHSMRYQFLPQSGLISNVAKPRSLEFADQCVLSSLLFGPPGFVLRVHRTS